MSTHTSRRRSAVGPTIRVDIKDLLTSKVSMLGEAMTPKGYSDLETDYDIRDHVFNAQPDERVVRMQIVWDIPADALEEVQNILDQMRERGAAMIIDAEEVKK